MARYQVYYDSNDGSHRWFNMRTLHRGIVTWWGRSVEDDFVRIPKRRILAIVRKDG